MTTLEPAKEFSPTVGINVARTGGLVPLLYHRSLSVEVPRCPCCSESNPVIDEENGGRVGKCKKRAEER
jgi:hypothetical protein